MSTFSEAVHTTRFDKVSREWCVVNDDGTVIEDCFENEAAARKWIDDQSPESIFPEELLEPEEIAAELRVKPETLAAWRSLGKGPPYLKVGKFVRYTRSDYVRWLKTHRQQPMTAQARRAVDPAPA